MQTMGKRECRRERVSASRACPELLMLRQRRQRMENGQCSVHSPTQFRVVHSLRQMIKQTNTERQECNSSFVFVQHEAILKKVAVTMEGRVMGLMAMSTEVKLSTGKATGKLASPQKETPLKWTESSVASLDDSQLCSPPLEDHHLHILCLQVNLQHQTVD